jgi:hypothetical protein
MKMIAALVFVAATAATAAAQPSTSSATSATSDSRSLADQDCARARKAGRTCVLTFGSESIDGKLLGPDGTDTGVAGNQSFSSLIHLRSDFRAEIIKAAEDI